MPTSQKPRKPRQVPVSKPKGTFARLRAEANADQDFEPYRIDDVDPPIEIHAPDSAESQLELAALFANDGTFAVADAKRILELVCGDAFPRVWELFRKEKVGVLLALIKDMGLHFQAQGAIESADEDEFPGGSPASSD